MAKLHHIVNLSLDGYIEDESGSFEWSETDDEVFAFLTELIGRMGTHLYGRRLYESMAVWETDPTLASQSDHTAAFAPLWQAAEKVVYSRTLDTVPTARTRVERRFEPDAVRSLKAGATTDLLIGGADLAGQALQAGLVDECHLLIRPVVLGGGKPALPTGARLDLELLDVRSLSGGVAYLRYRTST
jgi:dihydrofolate reductase